MAVIPQHWRVYARMQEKSGSTRIIQAADAYDEALNVVHQPDFQPALLTDADMERMAASAARRARHRQSLLYEMFLMKTAASGSVNESGQQERISDAVDGLEGSVIAREELGRMLDTLSGEDWQLLVDVAEGVSYEDLATRHQTTSSALRTRVCRIRRLCRSSNPCTRPRRQ